MATAPASLRLPNEVLRHLDSTPERPFGAVVWSARRPRGRLKRIGARSWLPWRLPCWTLCDSRSPTYLSASLRNSVRIGRLRRISCVRSILPARKLHHRRNSLAYCSNASRANHCTLQSSSPNLISSRFRFKCAQHSCALPWRSMSYDGSHAAGRSIW